MRCIALGLALAMGLATAATAEDKFTAGDVLAWEQSNQDAYFETSVAMAAVIASRNHGETATCIDRWYFASKAATASQNNEIRNVMQKYRDNHPGIVIAAIIERECGSLSFSK